jgi:NADPH-dependent curcumin reductase CurA
MIENRQWRLVSKPVGLVDETNLKLVTEPLGAPGPFEVLLKLTYLSLDPGLQVYMSSTQPIVGGIVNVGDVVRAWAVGRVVASKSEKFPVGSYARDHNGNAGIQDYAILHQSQLHRIDPNLAPLSAQPSVLGMPALTACFGLIDIGRPKSGETVVVSGASGAVGSMVGQIAWIKGCRAVGTAGGVQRSTRWYFRPGRHTIRICMSLM